MRVRIIFQADGPVWFPWHYPEQLQGFAYRTIEKASPELAARLHSEGFVVGSHRYKLITFSWLYPSSAVQKEKGLLMEPPINWWVSSPIAAVMEAFLYGLLTWSEVSLGGQKVFVDKVEVEPCPGFGEEATLETLSPIVASTGVREGERLHKVFLSPESPDFSRVITENLQRKAVALWGKEMPGEVEVKPLKYRSRLVTVHGTKVRCYEGVFEVKGTPELLKLGYEAGFGERNFQGFGMMRSALQEVAHEAQDPHHRRRARRCKAPQRNPQA